MCQIYLAHSFFPHCALAAPAAPEPRVSDRLLKARFTSVHLSRRPGVLQDVLRAVLHGLDAGAEREERGRTAAKLGGVDRGGEAAHPGAPAWGHGIEGVEVGCSRLLMLVMLGLLPGLEMVC
jgi:hypothetical protein